MNFNWQIPGVRPTCHIRRYVHKTQGFSETKTTTMTRSIPSTKTAPVFSRFMLSAPVRYYELVSTIF